MLRFSFFGKRLALTSGLLSLTASAAPYGDEPQEAIDVYDIFPIEVVVAKPTSLQLFCPENGVYSIDHELVFTVTHAPTTILTQTTKYSTFQTQTTIYREDCQQDAKYAFPTGDIPWAETCFPPTGANITLPPAGDRKIPLTVAIPADTYGACRSQPHATNAAKIHTIATNYNGPCRTVTNFGYAGPTPTSYRFPPGPGETLGLEITCQPGSPKSHSCNACVTYSKIVDGLPTPITVYLPPAGTQTEGSVIIITPHPNVEDDNGHSLVTITQPLSFGSEATTTTLQPDSPTDPTTVIILEPTSVPDGTVTITRAVPSPPGSTTTVPGDDPEDLGTVNIVEPTAGPGATITITSIITSGPGFTTTISADDPEDPDTVIVVEPTSEVEPVVTDGTTTFTVPIPVGSSFETTITATDDGPDTAIIGSPAPEEPSTETDREFPSIPAISTPMEAPTTTIPEETSATTTEESTVTATFVFTDTTTDPTPDPTGDEDTDPEATAIVTGDEDDEEATATVDEPGPSNTAPPADTSCDNAGFRYAMIPHNYVNSDAPAYSSVDVVALREARPVYIGRTQRIASPGYAGAPDFNLEYMAFNHEAYLNAVIGGEYIIEVPYVDDIVFVWIGQDAYSGWTRDNADLELGIFANVVKTLRFTLDAGAYLPVRVLFVNGQGGYSLQVTIRNPDGDIIAGSEGINSDYIVADTCGEFAPNFPAMPPVLDPTELVVFEV